MKSNKVNIEDFKHLSLNDLERALHYNEMRGHEESVEILHEAIYLKKQEQRQKRGIK